MRISLALTFEVAPTPKEHAETALTSETERLAPGHRVAGFQIPEPPDETAKGGPRG